MFCDISMQYYLVNSRTKKTVFVVQMYLLDLQYNMWTINFCAAKEWSSEENCKIHDKTIEWNKCNKLKQCYKMEKSCILKILKVACISFVSWLFSKYKITTFLQFLFIQFSNDWMIARKSYIIWFILHNQK